jgi:hypothetical protein
MARSDEPAMPFKDSVEVDEQPVTVESEGAALLHPLVTGQSAKSASIQSQAGVVIGELIALTDEGRTPIVVYPEQAGSAALRARSVIDLHSVHIGSAVVLMFEGGDLSCPIVMGVLRDSSRGVLDQKPGAVEVDADDERLVIRAKEQLVLRCGKASITLTKAGKILIQGIYVLSRSSGVNRIKGGSIQLN